MSDWTRQGALETAAWLLRHAPEWPYDGPALKVGQHGLIQWVSGDQTMGAWSHDQWRGIAEAMLAACHAYATERRLP